MYLLVDKLTTTTTYQSDVETCRWIWKDKKKKKVTEFALLSSYKQLTL